MRALAGFLTAVSLGLVLVACDSTGSITDVNSAVWAPAAMKAGSNAGDPLPIAMKPGAPPLATTHASFWAVQGRKTGTVIEYDPSAPGLAGQPFLQFTVPANTQLVDPTGRRLARGDSILIDIHVVPGQLEANFSPSGLVFDGKGSAELAISFVYGDLPVDPARWLAIWCRPLNGEAWEAENSRIDRKHDMVVADINHFSNYAVAYRK